MRISNNEGIPLFSFETKNLELKPIIIDITCLMLLFNCKNKTLKDIKKDKKLLRKINNLQNYINANYGGK